MRIQQSIENKLQSQLKPEFLRVENESHQHNVPSGSESHFKVTIV
ncbi:MAG: BolA/IbaG family iron-sulfur metabolism protein, partial [SAR324 cluster bacterium]|nr:BolA/IbaG family iron-sulfur metabolism protein [SAR324 cluster bacterium]